MEKQILELLKEFKHELSDMRKDQKEFKQELSDMRKDQKEFKQELSDMRKDQKEFKLELSDMRKDQKDFKQELAGMRKDHNSLRIEMRSGFAQVNDKLDILTKQTRNAVIETYEAGNASKKELQSLSSRVDKLEGEVYK